MLWDVTPSVLDNKILLTIKEKKLNREKFADFSAFEICK